jgi:hypothetical protein
MTNSQYESLWGDSDKSRTFMVLTANIDEDTRGEYGNIVVVPGVDPEQLLKRGKEQGAYPQDSYLAELVVDFDFLAEGVDFN